MSDRVEIGELKEWGRMGSSLTSTPLIVPADSGAPRQLTFDERYEVLETVSLTAMAEVLRCRDRAFARDVAMKVFRRATARPGSEWRFFREARVQGQLRHKGVIPVHDLGRDAEGDPFFTMTWVEGSNLSAFYANETPQTTLLSAIAELCEIISYAHDRGVVHRDLKPSNIFITDREEVFVLDWGLSKLHSDVAEDAMPIEDATNAVTTTEGSVLGTIAYMAPEQLRGEPGVDARVDTYAIGAMLYEALEGRPLHRGHKPQRALSVLQLDGAQLSEEVLASFAPLGPLIFEATRASAELRLSNPRSIGAGLRELLANLA